MGPDDDAVVAVEYLICKTFIQSKFPALTFLALVLSLTADAQSATLKYVRGNFLPLIETKDILDLDFKWNMNGPSQASLNEGINYLREGLWSTAVRNLDEAIKQDGKAWIAYYYRGIANTQLRELAKAETDFITVNMNVPTLAEGFLELGDVYAYQYKITKASANYLKAIEINPNLVQAYYNLGNLSLMRQDRRAAIKYYKRCNEINPKFQDAYIVQGLLKLVGHDHEEEALELFNKAIRADSTLAFSYFGRGVTYLRMKEPEQCLSDWNRAVRFQPGNLYMMTMRGVLLTELQRYDEAFVDFRKFLTAASQSAATMAQGVPGQEPSEVQLIRYLALRGYGLPPELFSLLKKAYCLTILKRYQEALATVKKARKTTADPAALFLQGLTYERLIKPDSAFLCYHEALLADSNIFEAHKKRGAYYASHGKWDLAERDFKEMNRIEPGSFITSPSTYLSRGKLKFQQGDYAGSVVDLTDYLTFDTLSGEAYRWRAEARFKLGEVDRAREDYERIVKRHPEEAYYVRRLADVCLSAGDTVAAMTYYGNWVYAIRKQVDITKSDEVNNKIRFELVSVYIIMKNWEAADNVLDTVKQFSRNYYFEIRSQMHYHRGKLEFARGNFTKAGYEFEDVLTQEPNNFEAKYMMAMSALRQGDKRSALKLFRQINGYLDAGEYILDLSGK